MNTHGISDARRCHRQVRLGYPAIAPSVVADTRVVVLDFPNLVGDDPRNQHLARSNNY